MVTPRERRIPIMFSEDELADIDDWRFANRIATRADAVRRLCKIALLVDRELRQVVDMTSNGVDILADHSAALSDMFRLVINRETYGMTFDRDQVWDVFSLAREQADVAEDGVRGLHTFLVTLFNAVTAIAEAKTIRGAQRKSQDVIDKANAAIDQADQRKAERDAISNENRYLQIILSRRTPEAKAAYEALSDDEQEEYLEKQIAAMAAEEAADPSGFAERFGVDDRKFWEKPEWAELLDEQHNKVEAVNRMNMDESGNAR